MYEDIFCYFRSEGIRYVGIVDLILASEDLPTNIHGDTLLGNYSFLRHQFCNFVTCPFFDSLQFQSRAVWWLLCSKFNDVHVPSTSKLSHKSWIPVMLFSCTDISSAIKLRGRGTFCSGEGKRKRNVLSWVDNIFGFISLVLSLLWLVWFWASIFYVIALVNGGGCTMYSTVSVCQYYSSFYWYSI